MLWHELIYEKTKMFLELMGLKNLISIKPRAVIGI
jgi:hypothetical protein